MSEKSRKAIQSVSLIILPFVLIFNVYLLCSLCKNPINEISFTKAAAIYSSLSILFYGITLLISLIHNSLIIFNSKSVGITKDDETIFVNLEIFFWAFGHICFYFLTLKRFQYLYTAQSMPNPKHKCYRRYILTMIISYCIFILGFTILLLATQQNPLTISKDNDAFPYLHEFGGFLSILYFFGGVLLTSSIVVPLYHCFIGLLIEAKTISKKAIGTEVSMFEVSVTFPVIKLLHPSNVERDRIRIMMIIEIIAKASLITWVFILCEMIVYLYLCGYIMAVFFNDKFIDGDAIETQILLGILHLFIIVNCSINSLCVYVSFPFADDMYKKCCKYGHKRCSIYRSFLKSKDICIHPLRRE
mmetsp:Transcript_91992/g.112650  ORF Transcript_91992/g.112650 Transcript_91992/m.112650 type:complete len:359 (-) Transcript_91992:144-1220(-)